MKHTNIRRIAKDISVLADSINRRRTQRSRCIPWSVVADARHVSTDMAALHRVIAWTVEQPITGVLRAWRAAIRLHITLPDLTAQQQAEVQLQLRVAEMCVVVTLKQQPDGRWIQLPIKDAAA
jgi:hypothetical protein